MVARSQIPDHICLQDGYGWHCLGGGTGGGEQGHTGSGFGTRLEFGYGTGFPEEKASEN